MIDDVRENHEPQSGTATDHEVVVVGAGPIGLMTAIELGRRGIDVHVIERRATRLRHPRASGIHARTMEIFRQLGWAEEVRQAGNLPLDSWSTFGYMTRLNAPDIGAIDLLADQERVDRALAESPELMAWCAQDTLEPFLLAKAEEFKTVRTSTGFRATALSQFDDHVALTIEGDDGTKRDVTARYAVGADGARSTIRALLGIPAPTSPTRGYQLNACFSGDMRRYLGDRRHILSWIINPETNGAFLTYDGDRHWVYSWAYDADRESIDDYPHARCAEVIRKAIGDDQAEVDVERVFPWTIDASIAERFHDRRTFLVGDAAHRVPPSGGFGMNSGIQDAQNLAWKLSLVLRDSADEALLETYNEERLAVALFNVEQIHKNVEASAKVGWLITDPEALAKIEEPDGADVRRQIADAIPLQEDQYWSYGQQFGFVYSSDAIVADATTAPVSTVGDYRPSAAPGAHAPHLWLRDPAGRKLSTIDLAHTGFVLFAGPDGRAWVDALLSLSERDGFPSAGYVIGRDGDYVPEGDVDWPQCYGITASGAVLIRPDGHVCFRAEQAADNPYQALETVFGRLRMKHAVAAPGAGRES